MSIGDIARRTYIQPKFIEAIEEDNLASVPDSHRRLFVREYAKVIGIPQDEMMALLDEFAPPPPPVPIAENVPPITRRFSDDTPPPSAPRLPEVERKTYADFMRRLSRGGGIKLGGNKLSRWLIMSAGGLLVIVAAYYLIFSGKSHKEGGAATVDSTQSSPTQVLTRGSAESGDSTGSRADSAAPASGDSLTLEGRATSKIWYAIVMDGKRSETDTLPAGGVRVWRASKNFKLSLGNAGGLQLSLNDKKLGTLGPLHTSVRNQIIDAAGIKKVLRTSTPPAVKRPPHTQQSRTQIPRVITPTELRTSPPR